MGASSRLALPLPPEITINILKRLRKKDAWSFAITSRTHYYLARDDFLFFSVDLGASTISEVISNEGYWGLRSNLRFIKDSNIGTLIREIGFGVEKYLPSSNSDSDSDLDGSLGDLEKQSGAGSYDESENKSGDSRQTLDEEEDLPGIEPEAAALIDELYESLPNLVSTEVYFVGHFSLCKATIEALGTHCPKLSLLDIYLSVDKQPDFVGFSLSAPPQTLEKLVVGLFSHTADEDSDSYASLYADESGQLSTLIEHIVRPTIGTLKQLEMAIFNDNNDKGVDLVSLNPSGARGLPLEILKYDASSVDEHPDFSAIKTLSEMFPKLEILNFDFPVADLRSMELDPTDPANDSEKVLPYFSKLTHCKCLRLNLSLFNEEDLDYEVDAAPYDVLVNHVSIRHREWIMRELVGVMSTVEKNTVALREGND